MLSSKLLSSIDNIDRLYVDDVFSAYIYTGNGSTKTINNGIDLAGKGGLVWIKARSAAITHRLTDSARGVGYGISTETTAVQNAVANGITAFNSGGFSLGGNGQYNQTAASYASWTFRNAPKFFKCATVTKSAGSNATVDLSSLGTVGMVTVKRTDSVGVWYAWHRSIPAGQLMYLNQTAVAATLGAITVSGTTLTLVNGVIADGSYVVYAWAHDDSEDGIIQCGSFTTDASRNATVNLGWELQYLLLKNSGGASDNWSTWDTMRGLVTDRTSNANVLLQPNLANAEASQLNIGLAATGFVAGNLQTSTTYIYLAIRRPNKPPTSGTEVFAPVAYQGAGTSQPPVTGVGFTPDAMLTMARTGSAANSNFFPFVDRLRGVAFDSSTKQLFTQSISAEATATSGVGSFTMDGCTYVQGVLDNQYSNVSTTYVAEFFRRAHGFFDVVCYTGNGAASRDISHGLGARAQLMLCKSRTGAEDWFVECQVEDGFSLTDILRINSNSGRLAQSVGAMRSSSTFPVYNNGAYFKSNTSGAKYIAYLFASLPGISKVGSYTGNGTSQTIPCGFTTGARFVLIKRTDSTGDWLIADTSRGIVAAADPCLNLNTTNAEVTGEDWLDPDPTGFIVNQVAATNINVTGATYIFLAVS